MGRDALNIQVIVGTVRSGRSGPKVADWFIAKAREVAPNVEFEILDVEEFALPLFNDATPPAYHIYNSDQEKLAQRITRADGFVFVTSEYNHSIPGSLKNLLDFVTSEWSHKAASFVGYGGEGAIRSIEHLIQVLNYLRVASTCDHVRVNKVWSALDESGTPRKEFVEGDVEANVKGLILWSSALRQVRIQPAP
jgi:NAD(P)H-dependent FMN reductase